MPPTMRYSVSLKLLYSNDLTIVTPTSSGGRGGGVERHGAGLLHKTTIATIRSQNRDFGDLYIDDLDREPVTSLRIQEDHVHASLHCDARTADAPEATRCRIESMIPYAKSAIASADMAPTEA